MFTSGVNCYHCLHLCGIPMVTIEKDVVVISLVTTGVHEANFIKLWYYTVTACIWFAILYSYTVKCVTTYHWYITLVGMLLSLVLWECYHSNNNIWLVLNSVKCYTTLTIVYNSDCWITSIDKTYSVRILQWINKLNKWCNNHQGGAQVINALFVSITKFYPL